MISGWVWVGYGLPEPNPNSQNYCDRHPGLLSITNLYQLRLICGCFLFLPRLFKKNFPVLRMTDWISTANLSILFPIFNGQEEYANEEEIGTLKKCGHNYHVNCIREWLLMKNSCLVCKGPALTNHSKYSK